MAIPREEADDALPGFGERLKALVKSQRWTVAGLAGEIGVHRITVFAWMAGRKFPSAAAVAKLADVLGVSADYLLGRK